MNGIIRLLVLLSMLLVVCAVSADPPAWAPAHGWRKKHDPSYVGQSGKRWSEDYGVLRGSCDYRTIGAVIGGAVGGAIGSSIGKGDGRAVAVLIGGVVGAVVGSRIGQEIEEQDRACIGHSLELAQNSRAVSWENPHTGVQYLLIPKNEYQRGEKLCRDFELHRSLGKRSQVIASSACLGEDRRWNTALR